MSSAPPSTKAVRPRSDWVIPVLIALGAAAACMFDLRVLSDGDTYWHLAAGQWMLAHGQVPHTDPFSYTFAGAPWHAHEWLTEVIMAAAFRAGGWGGSLALTGMAVGAAALALGAYVRRWLTGTGLLLAMILALACIAPDLLARPHVLVLPVVLVWSAALLAAREAGRAPHPALTLVMLAWANLHGGFVFGFLVLGVLALEALLEAEPARRWITARDWGLFGLLSLLAATMNPQGLSGLVFPFRLMAMTSASGIDEWKPADFSTPGPLELSLIAVLFLALSRGLRLRPLRLVLLLGLLHMALQHSRHVVIAAPLAALLLAEPFARTLEPAPASARAAPWAPRWAWAVAGLVALALLGARLALPVSRGDGVTTPKSAIDHLPPRLLGQPVLNDYGFGGYLIFRGVRPFIDGRADLYGDAFMYRYYAIANGDRAALEATLRRYGVTWTVFVPNSAQAKLMDREPGWTRLYADPTAVVHMRDAAAR